MPKAERGRPPFVQIADYYRDAIQDGQVQPGQRLPSIADIAREWAVSTSTAAKAITRLQVEGAIFTSPSGSFVSADEVISRTPGERIKAPGPARPQTDIAADLITVTAAGIVTPPDYVAALLGIEPGTQVVRREEITTRHARPRMLAVDWIPADNAMLASDLVKPEPIEGGAERLIASIAGRQITHAEDHLRGRGARDAREANALRLPIGTPILAGVHVWSDADGVILYGEWIMPPDLVIHYVYDVAGQPES